VVGEVDAGFASDLHNKCQQADGHSIAILRPGRILQIGLWDSRMIAGGYCLIILFATLSNLYPLRGL